MPPERRRRAGVASAWTTRARVRLLASISWCPLAFVAAAAAGGGRRRARRTHRDHPTLFSASPAHLPAAPSIADDAALIFAPRPRPWGRTGRRRSRIRREAGFGSAKALAAMVPRSGGGGSGGELSGPSSEIAGRNDPDAGFHRLELIDGGEGGGGLLRAIGDGETAISTLFDALDPSVWSASVLSAGESSRGSKGSGIFLKYSPPPKARDASFVDVRLGKLCSGGDGGGTTSTNGRYRWVACSRQTRYWMGPAFGGGGGGESDAVGAGGGKDDGGKSLPLDTQFVLIGYGGGTGESPDSEGEPSAYALVLPLVDGSFRASLQGGREKGRSQGDGTDSSVVCHIDSGDEDVHLPPTSVRAIYVIAGTDPYALLKRGFREVSDEMKTFATLDEKSVPEMADEFGWCTWDAFYSDVTPEGVLEGVASLRDAGVQPRTVILDDGWQEVTPTKKKHQKEETSSSTAVRARKKSSGATKPGLVLARVAGILLGVFAKVVEAFYERFVKRSAYGSLPERIWRYLTLTVLKGEMYNYFETETDFARQLNGSFANEKFQRTGESESANGLRDLVGKLKSEFGLKRVFCWHALHGYWRGISPEYGQKIGVNATNVVPRHSKHLLQVEPQISWDSVSLFGVGLLTDKSDLAKFYDSIHSPMRDAGIDGVKIDVQSGVAAVGGGVGGGPHLARLYTEAMEESVSERFASPATENDGGAVNCINCMGHSTENLYRYKKTALARASDDFYPRRPYSHTVHLINVAYNSLFIGEICLPDWDMFHSNHESAPLHAAARAVGGCPIYVSDAPGDHNANLLRSLVLPDGRTLRAEFPGRPTRDCLFSDVGGDGRSALKIWNANRSGGTGGGVVGAFNVQGVAWNFERHENEINNPNPRAIEAVVRPTDVETLRDEKGSFAAYRHRSKELVRLSGRESEVKFVLDHREWEITAIVPIQDHNSFAWAPIGLVNMLNSGGAIVKGGRVDQVSTSTYSTEISIHGPGRFLAYSSQRPSRVTIYNGEESLDVEHPFSYTAESCKLEIDLPTEHQGPHTIRVDWCRN